MHFLRYALVLCVVWSGVAGARQMSSFTRSRQSGRRRGRCSTPEDIPHGELTIRHSNYMRVLCDEGYQVQGPRIIMCFSQRWQGEKPVCAAAGCAPAESVENGLVESDSPYRTMLICREPHVLAGNRYTYCNGTAWDRPLGNCRKQHDEVQLRCDFEVEDICDWTVEQTDKFEWKRVATANRLGVFTTGPRHDHTAQSMDEGHYMLMESAGGTRGYVKLMSPIYDRELSLKTACCFRFYYYMYGEGVGTLSVYVKPTSITLTDMYTTRDSPYLKFRLSGNQGTQWHEGTFDIDNQDADFQIIFAASDAKTQLSDIGIDDVELMTGSACYHSTMETSTATTTAVTEADDDFETTENNWLFGGPVRRMKSCKNHCGEGVNTLEYLYLGDTMLCSCHFNCILNCCPDFIYECSDYLFSDHFNQGFRYITHSADNDETTNSNADTTIDSDKQLTPATTSTAATTTTTTTTPTPTTTTTTTKTTTLKPTTTSTTMRTPPTTTTAKTTTTTTTRKPTTTTSTTTTTTTTTTTAKPTTITTPRRVRTVPTTTTTTTTKKPTTTTITTTKKPPKSDGTIIAAWITSADANGDALNNRAPVERRQKVDSFNADDQHKLKPPTGISQTGVLLTVLALVMTTIVLAVVYHRHAPLIHAIAARHCRLDRWRGRDGGDDDGRGDVETDSITAEFRHDNIGHLSFAHTADGTGTVNGNGGGGGGATGSGSSGGSGGTNCGANGGGGGGRLGESSGTTTSIAVGTKLSSWLHKKPIIGRRDGIRTPLINSDDGDGDADDDSDIGDHSGISKVPNSFTLRQNSTTML